MNCLNFGEVYKLESCFDFFSGNIDIVESKFEIYPNPAYNEIYIETNIELSSKIRIYNQSGQLVEYEMLENQLLIDKLPRGVYFIYLHVTDGIIQEKFIKM